MTTTPPIQAISRAPPTPFQGAKYDNYEPYLPRRSSRVTLQRPARTPSPAHPTSANPKSSAKKQKVTLTRSTSHTFSPPSSPNASPQKNKAGGRHYKLTSKNTTTVSSSKDMEQQNGHAAKAQALDPATGMLPTPAKTPVKPNVAKPSIHQAARILFPANPTTMEEAMPSPRRNSRRAARHVGSTLDEMSDPDGEAEPAIEVYTDSQCKVPELDESDANPFYDKPGAPPKAPSPPTRASKRRKTQANGNNEDVSEAYKRGEGMVYVFRGVKHYRRFQDDQSETEDPNNDPTPNLLSHHFTNNQLYDDVPAHLHRPLTRSGIKPRLLFPTAAQRQAREPTAAKDATDLADEEALTDIEGRKDEDNLVTPVEESFAPVSPPTTVRKTRSSTKKDEKGKVSGKEVLTTDSEPELGVGIGEGGKKKKQKGTHSPFDSWPKTKVGFAVEGGKDGKDGKEGRVEKGARKREARGELEGRVGSKRGRH